MKITATLSALLTASAFVSPLAGAETRPDSSPPSATADAITVPLEYREVPFSVMSVSMTVLERSQPFRKEVDFGKSTVRRGVFQIQSTTNAPLPFIWNATANKLYLDSNRNGDLTDDPTGVYSTAVTSSGSANLLQGLFVNVRLEFGNESGSAPMLADLSFSQYRNRLSVFGGVRSFLSGRVSLDGNDWQLALVSGAPGISQQLNSGYLVLRPWAERDRTFNVLEGSLDAFQFRERVFVQNRIYQITPHYELKDGKPACTVTLQAQTAELGDLKISGKFIQRVILTSDQGMAVVIDKPEALVRIPAATYTDRRVQLGTGGRFAYLDRPPMRELVVSSDRQAELIAGGPLTNTVTLTQRGIELQLNYRLIGAGEDPYVLIPRDITAPPQFTAYQGTRQIGSGKFEFG